MKTLYYGDNLGILREHVGNETIDLIYLDPPFKSNQEYNVLFDEKDGTASSAQIKAFDDTWGWNTEAEKCLELAMKHGGRLTDAMKAFENLLHRNDMMAYLAMMAPRLVELHRVLKPTGSIYLHCDPTASHYLKLLMDAIFSPRNFVNEIIWKRTNARSTTGRWPRVHDVLLYYRKGEPTYFESMKVRADERKMPHTLVTGPGGKKYQSFELTGPGLTKEGESGKPWRGFDPGKLGRHWGNTHKTMDEWNAKGLIHWPADGGFPRRRDKLTFDPASRKVVVSDVWTDIDRINQAANERVGYPTQKPEALLERILTASSKKDDTVLDPFCGCGTMIAVAERMNRQWIGIDITYLAIALMKNRLRNHFGKIEYEVKGDPKDLAGAKALANSDRYEFQKWVVGVLEAGPREVKKGRDRGIDGRLHFRDEPNGPLREIIVSVKSGASGVGDVRELVSVVGRDKADIGVLVVMDKPTKDMNTEAVTEGFYEWRMAGAVNKKYRRIQILTVNDLLKGTRIDYPQGNITFKQAPKAGLKIEQLTLDKDEGIFKDFVKEEE